MRVTVDSVREIINKSKTGEIEWFKSDGVPCLDCDYQDRAIIICRYKENEKDLVSLTFTNDFGTIVKEVKVFKHQSFYQELSEFYNYIDENATVEL